jgi:hypothetical protein
VNPSSFLMPWLPARPSARCPPARLPAGLIFYVAHVVH